jgi:hypothetical protein
VRRDQEPSQTTHARGRDLLRCPAVQEDAVHLPPLIVCPLRFEAAALRRRGVGVIGEIICCGPGAENIRAWAGALAIPAGRMVVLAGLAGALRSGFRPGRAYVVGEVRAAGGQRWRPPLQPAGSAEAVVVISVAGVLESAAGKRALGEQFDAGLIDQESAAFAKIAAERGWRWGVVRGVSDGVDDELPRGVEQLVDSAGRTRPLRAVVTAVMPPTNLRRMVRLGIASGRAMRAVAEAMAAHREHWSHTPR